VELEIGGSGRQQRILGELMPAGAATIELRQPGTSGSGPIPVDEDGRFVIEDLRPGPFSLICWRPGRSPVATEWTSLS
jgi:hypothetical protein